ncbi:MAG: tetratricopeptide repeat protein [Cytophagales bacterium]|nr:tetratricopeptide repeat protein [Bernardetiaceae bacterium]MDW8210282.1 tetratricopeptide repeat protein [Cytophagales bacterium]
MNFRLLFSLVAVTLLAEGKLIAQNPSERERRASVDSLETERELRENSAEYLFIEAMQYFISENYSQALRTLEESRKLSPYNSAILYQIARTYAKLEDYNNALRYIHQAVHLVNDHPHYLSLLAEIYQKLQRYAEAEKTYARLVALRPDEINYYYDWANTMLHQSKYKEAIRVYDQLEKKIGLDPHLIQRKQSLYLEINQPEGALKEGKKLIEALPDEIESYLTQAELLLNLKRMEEARKLIAQAERLFPDDPRILLLSASLAKESGNQQEWLKNLEHAFENPSLEAELRLRILTYLYEESLASKDAQLRQVALSLAEKTIQFYPDHPQLQSAYAAILLENGKLAEAKVFYQKAVQLNGDNYQAWVGLIRIDVMTQNYKDLALHTEQALEYYPNNATFLLYNGTAHLVHHRYDEAVEALEQSLLLAAGNRELLQNIYAQLGDAYNGQKQYQKSDQAYEEALMYDPNNRHVLNNYSYFLALRRQNLDKAKEMSSRLVKLEPENASYLDTHGWVLYVRGEYQAALPFLEKAARLNPSHPTIVEHYGDVLFKIGKAEEALKYWQLAQKNGGDSPLLKRKIAEKKLVE